MGAEKLLLAILPEQGIDHILDALTAEGYQFTRVSSTGGFFRKGRATLMIGVEEERLDAVLQLLKETCRGMQAERLGRPGAPEEEPPPCGVTVFVLGVDLFQRV